MLRAQSNRDLAYNYQPPSVSSITAQPTKSHVFFSPIHCCHPSTTPLATSNRAICSRHLGSHTFSLQANVGLSCVHRVGSICQKNIQQVIHHCRPTYKKSTRRFKTKFSLGNGRSELGCDRPPQMKMTLYVGGGLSIPFIVIQLLYIVLFTDPQGVLTQKSRRERT